MSEDKLKTYSLTADYKKCTYQTEQWNNVLSNGKHVRFEVTNYFYWGTFEIDLSDKEKEEILKKDSIILNDYSVSCPELDSGCADSNEICNEDSYTEEELMEINRLIYRSIEDEEYDSDEEYSLDTSVLEQNGWSMDDTIYGMDTGCELELISIEEDDKVEPEPADITPATEKINTEIDLFLVAGLQGTNDEGWCFRFEEEFENKDIALDYYEKIELVQNKDIDWYEEKNNGEVGVQQKQLRRVKVKKIGNGIYDYDDDSGSECENECITEDEEEEDDDIENEVVSTEPAVAVESESATESNNDMVDCEGCEKSVLRSDSQPFVEDQFLCEVCIDMNLEYEILYNCCNICDKFYHAADDDNNYDDYYDGDVCYLCLPGIMERREEVDILDTDEFCIWDKKEEEMAVPDVDMFCI